MNFSKTMSLLLLAALSMTVSQVSAEQKWWEKAISIIKPDNNRLSKTPGNSEINQAFKQALRLGAETVVTKLSALDGFNGNPEIHISLPKALNPVKKILGKVGMSSLLNEFELTLNRAGEAATPKAKQILLQSISDMKFSDVQSIYRGSNDSATRYFKTKMSAALRTEISPIIQTSLADVGAIKAFNGLMSQYRTMPFVPEIDADITNHVIKKTLQGIFHQLAKEEAAIRQNPKQQTTALLKKVFSRQ